MHFNTSHTIHHLSFGESFDNQVNPLSDEVKLLTPEVAPSAVYQYYIKLVPFSFGKYGTEGDPVRLNSATVWILFKCFVGLTRRLRVFLCPSLSS